MNPADYSFKARPAPSVSRFKSLGPAQLIDALAVLNDAERDAISDEVCQVVKEMTTEQKAELSRLLRQRLESRQ